MVITRESGPAVPTGAGPAPDPAAQALIEEARRRHRRRLVRRGAVALGVALTAGLIVAGLAVEGGTGPRGRHPGRPPTGLFASPTGDVLVFADGLRLDLDHRVADRQPIPGQRAGDQPYDIVHAGNALVVGWGEVWATSIGRGTSRLLGPVVTFVPAAEPGAVWLVDYPGGRIGEGTPTLREVTTTGTTLRTKPGPPPSEGTPAIGIPGGLAFQTGAGVGLWNAKAGTFTRRLGTEAGFIGDEAGGRLAWCQGLCTTLHVTDVPTGADHLFASPQAGQYFQPESVRLSPDGREVAAITTRPGLEAADQQGALDVIDIRTGAVRVVVPRLTVWSTLAWTADGRALFVATDAGHGMTIRRYDSRTGRTAAGFVPVANAEQFVILPRRSAGVFLTPAHGAAAHCGSQSISPGVPSPPCGRFSF